MYGLGCERWAMGFELPPIAQKKVSGVRCQVSAPAHRIKTNLYMKENIAHSP